MQTIKTGPSYPSEQLGSELSIRYRANESGESGAGFFIFRITCGTGGVELMVCHITWLPAPLSHPDTVGTVDQGDKVLKKRQDLEVAVVEG